MRNGTVVGAGGIGLLAVLVISPVAAATYNSYGVLYAFEGSTKVAEGKGIHGTEGQLWAGGHMGSRDPRPGGSPAYGEVFIRWYAVPGVSGPGTTLQGARNMTSSWIDNAKYVQIPSTYFAARTNGKACQDDALQPDACASSSPVYHQWHDPAPGK